MTREDRRARRDIVAEKPHTKPVETQKPNPRSASSKRSAPAVAVWKGLDRATVEQFIDQRIEPPQTEHGGLIAVTAADVIDQTGLRCVGWHAWTGDPRTSTPLFIFDEWPGLE